MAIDLNQIEDLPLTFDEKFELAADRLDPDLVAGTVRVRLDGKITPMPDSFLVEATIGSEGSLFCSRCLTPVAWQRDDSFVVEIRSPATIAGEELELSGGDLEVVFLDGNELDLSQLAADQVMLGLPMRILCGPECAGLCPKCGANLNLDDQCSCDPDVDPRWEALKGIQGHVPE